MVSHAFKNRINEEYMVCTEGCSLSRDSVLWVSVLQELGKLWNTGIDSTAIITTRSRFFLCHEYMGTTNIFDMGYGDRP